MSDTSAPVISLNNLEDGFVTAATPLTVAGRVTDNSAVASLTLGGTPVALAADGSFSRSVALVAGTNTLAFDASDCEGNSQHLGRTVFLDVAPPQLAVAAPAPNAILASATVAVSGTASDDIAVAAVSVNGQPASLSGTS